MGFSFCSIEELEELGFKPKTNTDYHTIQKELDNNRSLEVVQQEGIVRYKSNRMYVATVTQID